MPFKKENLPLVIGLAIPVLMVIVLAAIIYLPRLYVKPTYDFVYVVGDYPVYIDYVANTRTTYAVLNGRVTVTETAPYSGMKPVYDNNRHPQFYRYDLATQKSVALSLDEVKQLDLNTSIEAPDGFKLNYGRSDDNIFEAMFEGRDYSTRVLEKGSVAVKVNLNYDLDRYYHELKFIGWVNK